jgi:uncharacterized protein YjbI with pentapeptide repeats
MQARSEPMQGDWVAREQRSIRITEIINHGLHRQTDSMAGWIFEQGQANLSDADLSLANLTEAEGS